MEGKGFKRRGFAPFDPSVNKWILLLTCKANRVICQGLFSEKPIRHSNHRSKLETWNEYWLLEWLRGLWLEYLLDLVINDGIYSTTDLSLVIQGYFGNFISKSESKETFVGYAGLWARWLSPFDWGPFDPIIIANLKQLNKKRCSKHNKTKEILHNMDLNNSF